MRMISADDTTGRHILSPQTNTPPRWYQFKTAPLGSSVLDRHKLEGATTVNN